MSHHAEHVDPNAWRGGGNKVGAVDAEVGSGYNMLHLFPDELRLVGAGSSKSANEITVYNADATVSDVLSGHKSMVLSVATDGVIIASGPTAGTDPRPATLAANRCTRRRPRTPDRRSQSQIQDRPHWPPTAALDAGLAR